MNDLRELSRRNWTGNNTREELTLGCTLRMADAAEKMAAATEKMAIHHDQLMRERDYLRERYRAVLNEKEIQAKSIRSLRGHVTKLKKKVAALKQNGRVNEQTLEAYPE